MVFSVTMKKLTEKSDTQLVNLNLTTLGNWGGFLLWQ
jgi:hypothetical protein